MAREPVQNIPGFNPMWDFLDRMDRVIPKIIAGLVVTAIIAVGAVAYVLFRIGSYFYG